MPRTRQLTSVERHQIPDFATEEDEAAYWRTHELAPSALDQMRPARDVDPELPSPRTESILRGHSRNLSVRFDLDTIRRLRRVAAKKGIGYQTLLKTFVAERLYEEEKREGLLH